MRFWTEITSRIKHADFACEFSCGRLSLSLQIGPNGNDFSSRPFSPVTAEIAVLNRTAVALAADSASTSLQAGLPKIFNTADKLFHLDGVTPIGVMVYGNSGFMSVPWETIIKKYRASGPQKSATLAAAAQDFLSFLTSATLFSDKHLHHWIEINLGELAREMAGLVQTEKQRIGPTSTTASVCADVLVRLRGWPLLPGVTDVDVDGFVKQWDSVLDTGITAAFANDLPDPPSRQNVKSILARVNLTLPQLTDGAVSGVVLAGFGDEELFPVLWNCQLRSVLPSRSLQTTVPECEPLAMEMGAMIRPFAQAEMVYSFMNGIDPNLRQTIEDGVSGIVRKFSDHLAAATGFTAGPLTAFKSIASTTATTLNQSFRDEIERYCRQKHVDPVLAAIGLLPKDQLALMAETLVSLTSFKRKMSRDAETVGGDVDVAVISKGDGFIWVKRKHYFPPELNLRYIERIRQP